MSMTQVQYAAEAMEYVTRIRTAQLEAVAEVVKRLPMAEAAPVLAAIHRISEAHSDAHEWFQNHVDRMLRQIEGAGHA